MAAVVKTAAFAMFARVFYEALGGSVERWHSVLWWLAALTMVVGNLFALAQKNLTRLIAYSSIAHAGYLLVALLGYSQASSTAIVFYLVAYTLTTMGTFAVLVSVNGGRDQSPTLADVTGLWQSRPALACSHGGVHAVIPRLTARRRHGLLCQVVRVAGGATNKCATKCACGHSRFEQRCFGGGILSHRRERDVHEITSRSHCNSCSTVAHGWRVDCIYGHRIARTRCVSNTGFKTRATQRSNRFTGSAD